MAALGSGEIEKVSIAAGDKGGDGGDGGDDDGNRLRISSSISAASANDANTETAEAAEPAEPAEQVKSKSPVGELFGDKLAICQHCKLNEYAVAYCKDCGKYLCDGCYSYHGIMTVTSGHVVIESPNIESLRDLYYCKNPDHSGSELIYFCKTCNSPICQNCFVTTCLQHEKILENVIRSEIKELLDGVKANKNAFHEFGGVIDKVMSDSDDAAQICMQEVNSIFSSWAEELERKKEQVLSFLKAKKEKNFDKNKEQRELVESLAEDMGTAISDTETLLQTKRTSRIMVNKLLVCARLENCAMEVWNKEAAVYQSWKLQHKPVLDYTDKFGHLIPKPRPEDIVIGGLINQQAKVGVTNTFTVTINNISDQLIEFDEEEAKNFVSAKILFSPDGRQGEPEKNTMISNKRRRDDNRWIISYLIRMEGMVSISLSVCGNKIDRQPFMLRATKVTLKEGERVQRGPDWEQGEWGNQGGGESAQGTVTRHTRQGWVNVKWDANRNNKTCDYRFGHECSFDVEPVPIK